MTYLLFRNRFRLEYLVLPLITLAAWRFGLKGAAPAALVASLVAVWSAVHSTGPFASGTLLDKMVTLQAFNVSMSLASLLLTSYVTVREQKDQMSRLYEHARVAIAAKTDAINVAARDLGPALGS